MNIDPGTIPASSCLVVREARRAALPRRRRRRPRVVECRNTLTYWRIRRAVDNEQEVLGPVGSAAVNAALLAAMPTGEAAAVTP